MLTQDQLYSAASHLMARCRQLEMQAESCQRASDTDGARELRGAAQEAKGLSDTFLQLAQRIGAWVAANPTPTTDEEIGAAVRALAKGNRDGLAL